MTTEERFQINLGYFVSACVGLYWSYRELKNPLCYGRLEELKKKIKAAENISNEQDFLYIKGELKAFHGECVEDELFLTTDCLKLRRKVEMYLNYKHGNRYDTKWFKRDFNSSKFKRRFKNPEWKLKSFEKVYKGTLMIDDIKVPDTVLDSLNIWKDVIGTYKGKDFKQFEENGKKILYQSKKFTIPKVGDYRVSHQYIPNRVLVSLLGKKDGENLVPYENLLLVKQGSYTALELINDYEMQEYKKLMLCRVFCSLSMLTSYLFFNKCFLTLT